MAFEALCLPDRNVDSVHTIPNASDDARNNHLDFLCCRSLQDGSHNHDPASDMDAAFPSQAVSGKESNDSTNETANVVDGGDDAFEVWIWVVKVTTEGAEADDSS